MILKTGVMAAENLAMTLQEHITFDIIFKKKAVISNCNNILQYYSFYCIFDQINATLVSREILIIIRHLTPGMSIQVFRD